MKQLLFAVFLSFLSIGYGAVITWNGSVDNLWANPNNWTPAQVPLSSDDVVINAGTNSPQLTSNTTTNNFTQNGSTLDLNSFSLNINGAAVFNAGSIHTGSITISSTSATFGGTWFNANITATCGDLYFNGSRFQGSNNYYFTKTGSSTNISTGGTVFESGTTYSITHNGSGDLVFASTTADDFSGFGTITNNTASNQIRLADNSPNNFINGYLTLDNGTGTAPGTRNIHVARGAAASLTVNATLNVNNNGSNGIYFGADGGQTLVFFMSTFGSMGFVDGTLSLANMTFQANTNLNFLYNTAALILGPNSTFSQGVSAVSPRLFLNGASYTGNVSLVKSGASNDLSLGGNVFDGSANYTITLGGTGDMVLGTVNPDQFLGFGTIYNNSASNQLRLAESSAGNVISGWLTLDNGTSMAPGTRTIHVARENSADLTINGTLNTNNNGSAGIYFGENGGQTNFSSTASHSSVGFVDGTLSFAGTTFDCSASINFMYNTASLVLGPNSAFNQGISADSPRIFLNGATYTGNVTLVKSGTSTDLSLGGNVFDGSAIYSIILGGTGDLVLGTVNPDQFMGFGTIYNNSAANQVRIAESSAGNVISGWLTLDNGTSMAPGTRTIHVARENSADLTINGTLNTNNNGSAGIYFGENGGQTNFSSLATHSSMGFVDGTLSLAGTTFDCPASINFMYNTASLVLGPNSAFNQGISADSPRLFLNGASYTGNVTLVKSGASTDLSLGGNVFDGLANYSIILGGTGDLVLGTVNPDQFMGVGTIYNNSTSNQVRIAESSVGNVISGLLSLDNGTAMASSTRTIHVARENSAQLTVNGNLNANNNGSTGIYFGQNGGQTTFSSSGFIGSLGFIDGTLLLSNVTANSFQSLNSLSGTAALELGPNSAFNNGVDFSSPRLFLNGSYFDGTATLVKFGASDDLSLGGNEFAASSTYNIYLGGTGDLVLGTVDPDQFLGTGNIVNNSSSNRIRIAESSVGNIISGTLNTDNGSSLPAGTRSIHFAPENGAGLTINGALNVNNNGSNGFYFGQNGGQTTFAASASLGSLGFVNGSLSIRNTVFNNTNSWYFLSSFANLILGPATTFNASITAASPNLFMNGVTSNAVASFTQFSTGSNVSEGGNVYNANITFVNNSSGQLLLAGTNPDRYNGLLAVNNLSSGNIDLAYTNTAQVYGNINFNLVGAATSGTNGGYIDFLGANAQAVSNTGTYRPVINQLRMNKTANDLTLNCPVDVGVWAEFLNRNIVSTATNYLQFVDNASFDDGIMSDLSFVDGPVRKVGDDFFVFPVGKGGRYQPAAFDAPSNVTDVFQGEYFPSNSNALYPHVQRELTINNISTCDYWMIDRLAGSSSVNVWLSWSAGGCNGIGDMNDLVVARWDGASSEWKNHGNGGTFGNATDGYMTSAIAPTSYSPFALASVTPINPLPLELISFSAEEIEGSQALLQWETASESDLTQFIIERSSDGIYFEEIGTVAAIGQSQDLQVYRLIDEQPVHGTNYYRLSEENYNGERFFVAMEVLNFGKETAMYLFPNPVSSTASVNLLGVSESVQLNVYDEQGRMILQCTTEDLNLHQFDSGIYHVVVEEQKTAKNLKLVVID